ncbi:MAG: hypothetical protein AAFR47_21585 [Pseudomonadota bacterium]
MSHLAQIHHTTIGASDRPGDRHRGLRARLMAGRRAIKHARDYRALLRKDEGALADLGLTHAQIRAELYKVPHWTWLF